MKRIVLATALALLAAPLHVAAQQQTAAAAPAQQAGALIVIDGVIIGNGFILGLDDRDLEALNIVSFEIVKKDIAVRLYGDRAREGALILRTAQPRAAAEIAAKGEWKINADATPAPMMYVDGVAMGYTSSVRPSFVDEKDIESIEVIKGKAAELHGHQAGGAIMITTKKKN